MWFLFSACCIWCRINMNHVDVCLQSPGFLEVENRLNVALTRAQFKLAVYSNRGMMEMTDVGRELLEFYEAACRSFSLCVYQRCWWACRGTNHNACGEVAYLNHLGIPSGDLHFDLELCSAENGITWSCHTATPCDLWYAPCPLMWVFEAKDIFKLEQTRDDAFKAGLLYMLDSNWLITILVF